MSENMNDFVCDTCNLFTNMSDQNKAKAFHRRIASGHHEPDLITYGQWLRKNELDRRKRKRK